MKRTVIMSGIIVALVVLMSGVPVWADDCCPCPNLCLKPTPSTFCDKVLNTAEQPFGFAADMLTFHWVRAGKRVVGTAVNVATLPFDVVANAPCGCGCEINDFAPKVTCPTFCGYCP